MERSENSANPDFSLSHSMENFSELTIVWSFSGMFLPDIVHYLRLLTTLEDLRQLHLARKVLRQLHLARRLIIIVFALNRPDPY